MENSSRSLRVVPRQTQRGKRFSETVGCRSLRALPAFLLLRLCYPPLLYSHQPRKCLGWDCIWEGQRGVRFNPPRLILAFKFFTCKAGNATIVVHLKFFDLHFTDKQFPYLLSVNLEWPQCLTYAAWLLRPAQRRIRNVLLVRHAWENWPLCKKSDYPEDNLL